VRKAGGLPANAQESPGLYTLDLHTLALRYPSSVRCSWWQPQYIWLWVGCAQTTSVESNSLL